MNQIIACVPKVANQKHFSSYCSDVWISKAIHLHIYGIETDTVHCSSLFSSIFLFSTNIWIRLSTTTNFSIEIVWRSWSIHHVKLWMKLQYGCSIVHLWHHIIAELKRTEKQVNKCVIWRCLFLLVPVSLIIYWYFPFVFIVLRNPIWKTCLIRISHQRIHYNTNMKPLHERNWDFNNNNWNNKSTSKITRNSVGNIHTSLNIVWHQGSGFFIYTAMTWFFYLSFS